MNQNIVEITYLVKNETGLFSNGNRSPSFVRRGRVWNNLEEIKRHLSAIGGRPIYANCTLVERKREMIESETEYVLDEFISNLTPVEKTSRLEARDRRETREKEDRRKTYLRLKEEFQNEGQ